MSKCKFCGKELKVRYEDFYYEYVCCNCDGMKKSEELKIEIAKIEQELGKKKKDLADLELSGAYGEAKRQFEDAKEKVNDFEDGSYERY